MRFLAARTRRREFGDFVLPGSSDTPGVLRVLVAGIKAGWDGMGWEIRERRLCFPLGLWQAA